MGESEIDKDGGGKVGRRPTIAVPPRAPFESLFAGGTMPGYSPGPMTLLSNIFSPDSSSCSFSQLLAGAMASPHAKPAFMGSHDCGNSEDSNFGDGNEKGSFGYKQNRPGDLVLAQSPAFTFPPGLSPSGFLNSPGFLSPLQSPFGMSHQQALAHVTAQAALSQYVQSQADFQRSSAESLELKQSSVPSETMQPKVHTLEMDPYQNLRVESSLVAQSDHKPGSSGFDKPGSDGYNWRKYGQKLVKTKEYPRSYYKCTHPCCPVKKKVEHGNDGQVTEITYKGQHNHEKPPPNARAKDGSGPDKATGSRVKPEMKISNETTLHFTDGASTQVPYGQLLITGREDEMEESATVVNDDSNHNNEPNAKRRNIEAVVLVPTSTHQTITEPKIVVQTRSEVDLLDDGFKWRKYGQKVVKGSAHPRSYYRCTFAGCNVRKHVERASLDPKSVITTYEGKHNHEIPSGRNSGQNNVNSGGQSKPQNAVARKPPPPVHREVDFGNKDHIAVLTQI